VLLVLQHLHQAHHVRVPRRAQVLHGADLLERVLLTPAPQLLLPHDLHRHRPLRAHVVAPVRVPGLQGHPQLHLVGGEGKGW
jgi:hypothetical protein